MEDVEIFTEESSDNDDSDTSVQFDITEVIGNCGHKPLETHKNKERLPTRRPNPNIFNRNALMARENRRKKKIYLETIEKELVEAHRKLRYISKKLKTQIKLNKRLERQAQYFKKVAENRSELMIKKTLRPSPKKLNVELSLNQLISRKENLSDITLFSEQKRFDQELMQSTNECGNLSVAHNPSGSLFCLTEEMLSTFTDCESSPYKNGWTEMSDVDILAFEKHSICDTYKQTYFSGMYS